MKKLFITTVAIFLLATGVYAEESFSINDYNNTLVKFGVPFYQQYPASFYTGFAPRIEAPQRIHFRAGRGNQVRLTAILDEQTVLTYLYQLKKRYDAYGEAAVDQGQQQERGQTDGADLRPDQRLRAFQGRRGPMLRGAIRSGV
jgi:hypothetical protein